MKAVDDYFEREVNRSV